MKAPGAVVAPPTALTTWMPLPVVSAPGPPALVTRTMVLPVAVSAADDQSVGGRAVAPEHGIHRHRAARSPV